MTADGQRPTINPDAPEVVVPDAVPCAAGVGVRVPVRIGHRGRIPAALRITVLGLDARWAPEPLDLGVLEPGQVVDVTLTLVPERGALGARYPFVVAVEATAVRGGAAPVMGIAESVLAVDSQERISMAIAPPTPTAVFSRAINVQITNPGSQDREFALAPSAAQGVSLNLRQDQVLVPARRTVTVKGRIRVRRPKFFGGTSVHAFGVSAQGAGAPEYAEGSVRAAPMFRRGAVVAIGLALTVALWAALAVVFIPKISDAFKPKSPVAAPATVTSQGPAASTGPAGTGQNGKPGQQGSGGGPGGGGSGGGSGGSGSGGTGSGGANAENAGYQLTGTVTGPGPGGVTVTLAPTSLVGATAAQPAPNASAQTVSALRSLDGGAVGKIPAAALGIAPARTPANSTTTVVTGAAGQFSFAGILAPGYYLLTLAKAGFQSQQFLINSADLASPNPLKVAMAPGNGSISGRVATPGGAPIGAATITVTDGTVNVQTSSVSPAGSGTPGTWKADGLSTPGTYLVTATAPGYGGASSLVTLGASGTGTTNLTLVSGQASITGTITGVDGLGNFGGLGGITVSATAGTLTRTATTVTSQALRGTYILPNMPAPGTYTMTISGDGFLTQTRTVTLTAGVGTATVDATLSRADGTVQGTVTGVSDGKSQGGLVGVGLTLTSSTTTLKTMTTSGAAAGGYRFTGVPPGTYVLTASQFGRLPSSATVHVTASQTQTVNLTLTANADTELPQTSHIRGQVVDSRTGGPLTCDRTAVPIPANECIATASVTVPVDPANPGRGTTTITATTSAALGFVYTLPNLGDPKHPGLAPGLYTVTISAPGYETSITHVQVAQGQMAPAPLASLPVLGIISGTVTTRVGTPSKPTCVIAVPLSVALPGTLPTSCAPDGTATRCTVPGVGTWPCGLTSTGAAGQGPAGTYQVRGLSHGQYQMLVIAQDPEYRYVVNAAPVIQLELGGDGQFNAVLDRLGRIQVTVFNADRKTGALTPAKGVTLTITDASGKTRNAGTTAGDGTATITELNGSYTVTATLGGTPASGVSGPVGLNQTVSMTLVIAAPVGPVVGQIVTTGIDDKPMALAGARVTITGTVDYNGSTPLSGTANVTTDAHGCYAIIPAGWKGGPPLTTAACPAPVAASAVVSMTNDGTGNAATLKTDRIGIAVAPLGNVTQGYPVTNTVITGTAVVREIPTVSVLPQPVTVGDQTMSVAGPTTGYAAPDLSTAIIEVLNKPALAGGVTITAAPTTPNPDATAPVSTSLSFADSNLPTQGGSLPTAMPGRYALQLSLANFVTARVDLLCQLGGTCAFVEPGTSTPMPGGLVLKQQPSITGAIPAPALPPTSGNPTGVPDWAGSTVNLITGPTQLGNLSVRASSNPFVGQVLFSGATSVLAASGGKYVFKVTVPGYDPENITVTCGADYSASPPPTGCTPLTPSSGHLTQLPTFAGTVQLNPGGTTVKVTATAVDTLNPAHTIEAGVGSNGTITWGDSQQPQGLVAPGSYAITVSAPGFAATTVSFTCPPDRNHPNGPCGPGVITVNMLPQITGTITTNGGPATNGGGAKVAVQAAPSNAGPITVSVDATSGKITFRDGSLPAPSSTNGLPNGLAVPGTYTFSVSLNGYQPQQVSVTCGANYSANPPPTGCTAFAPSLQPLPTLTGSTVALSSATRPITGVPIPVSTVIAQVSPNPGSSISATVAADGTVNWNDTSPGVLPGQVLPLANGAPYTITYSLPGFQTQTATLTCATSDTPCTQSPASVTLQMLPAAGGTVAIPLLTGQSSVNLAGSIIKVSSTKPSSAANLQVSFGAQTPGSNGNVDVALTWNDSTLPFPGIVQPDTYTLTITVPGYQTATVSTIGCTNFGQTCGPPTTVTLVPNPQPTLSLTILPPTLTPAVLAVTGGPSGAAKVTLTANAQGALTWQQGNSPAGVITPGSTPYTIQVQMPGYDMVVNGSPPATAMTFAFNCTTATCTWPDVVLTAPSTLNISLQDASGAAAGAAALTLTRTVGGNTTTVGSPTTNNGTATFATLSTTGVQGTNPATAADLSYSLSVQAAGFAFASGSNVLTSASSNVTCTNGSAQVTGLQVIPGGTTSCVVTLTRLAAVTGATVWDIMPLTGTTTIGTNQLPNALVSLSNTTGTFTGTSNSSGALSITGTTQTAGLSDGTWTIASSPAGFQPLSGTMTIAGGKITAVSPDSDDGVDSWIQLAAGGSVTLHLKPTTVAFQVHLNNGTTDVLAGAKVTLTDQAQTPNTVTCDSSVTPAPACVATGSGGAKYVSFTGVPPGTYSVAVTWANGSFTDIPATSVVIQPTGKDQQYTFTVTAHASTLKGAVVDGVGKAIPAATVTLYPWQGSAPAKDFNGNPFAPVQTASDGTFSFSNVPNGNYQVRVTHQGYQNLSSGLISVTFGQPVQTQTLAMSPTTRNVTFTVASAAGPGGLSGASVTLTPNSSDGRLDGRVSPDTPQSNLSITGAGTTASPYTVSVPSLPTGSWLVSVTGQPNAPFPVAASAPLAVPETGAVTSAVTLAQAKTTITITWTAVDCVTPPGDGQTIPLTLTQGTGPSAATSPPIPATVSAADSTAVATVYLPAASYSWTLDVSGLPGWQAPAAATTFTVAASATTASSSTAITAKTTTVTVNLTAAGAPGNIPATVTAACAADATQTKQQTLTGNTATLTLPTATWNFSIAATSNSYDILLPDQDGIDLGTTSTVTFTGNTLIPKATLQAVPGRPGDSRGVDLNLYAGATATGAAVWSVSGAQIWSALPASPPTGAATSYTGPTLVLPSGSYSLAATPPPTDVFGPASVLGINVTSTHSATATLPYTAAITAVTVAGGPPGAAAAAIVTLETSGGAAVSGPTSKAGAVTTFYDLDAATAYTASATYTASGGTKYAATGPVTTGAAGSTTPLTLTLASQ